MKKTLLQGQHPTTSKMPQSATPILPESVKSILPTTPFIVDLDSGDESSSSLDIKSRVAPLTRAKKRKAAGVIFQKPTAPIRGDRSRSRGRHSSLSECDYESSSVPEFSHSEEDEAPSGLADSKQALLKFRDFASIGNLESNADQRAFLSSKSRFKRSMREERLARRETYTTSSVQVFDHDLQYKSCGSVVLFKSEHVFKLIQSSLPLGVNLYSARSVANNMSTQETKIHEECLRKNFISWNSLKTMINEPIYDQALRDLLNSYAPFDNSKSSPDAFDVKLEKDHMKIAGMDISFIVSRGNVYFDILGSFTIMGELKIAMRHRWETVDQILDEAHFRRKDAFRRCHKGTLGLGKGKSFNSQRSHILLKALRVLSENGLVSDPERKAMLVRLFDHLEEQIMELEKKKRNLSAELQLTVDMIQRTGRYSSMSSADESDAAPTTFKFEDGADESSSPEEMVITLPAIPSSSSCEDDVATVTPLQQQPTSTTVSVAPVSTGKNVASSSASLINAGTEKCESACGRQYHFTMRCCAKTHSLCLAGKNVGYIVKGSQIFFDKCKAFAALGRMYVIRCSDYRKSDKIMHKNGMNPTDHYLFEKRNYGAEVPRNRRTHISLEAFITLVHAGFADSVKNEALIKTIAEVKPRLEELKADCTNFSEGETVPEATSSVGEDSGTTTLPESQKLGTKIEQPQNVPQGPIEDSASEESSNTVKVLGRNVEYRIEHRKMYLKLSVISDFLSDEDRLVPRLKRRARSLDLTFPFFPSYFKRGAEQFISLECIIKLIEHGQVNPGQKKDLLAELFKLAESPIVNTSNEDFSPIHAEADRSDSEDNDELEGLGTSNEPEDKPAVKILETLVPYQVVNSTLYLEKKAIFQLFAITTGPYYRTYRAMDKVLEQAKLCLDDAFLYEGRKRGYISSGALIILAQHNFITDDDRKASLLARLEELESEKESLKTNRTLELPSFETIAFKSFKNTIYVHTIQVLRAAGFSPVYLENSPSKAYFSLCKLLTQRGLNLGSCFLKQGKSKYVYVSLRALFLLFETEFGPFKDKEKMGNMKKEIIKSLHDQGFLNNEDKRNSNFEKMTPSKSSKYIILGSGFSPIRYRIKEGRLYVHRRSCFDTFGLEKVIMTCTKGYSPINGILLRAGMRLGDCYLSGKRERFAYISLNALLTLLESQDPLLICLEKKERFFEALLTTVQSGVANTITYNETVADSKESPVRKIFIGSSDGAKKPLPFKLCGNRMYLSRHTSYAMSGLYDKAEHAHGDYDIFEEPTAPLIDRGIDAGNCFLSDGGDPYAYISVDALLILMNLDGDISRAADYNKLIWKNLISAISLEAPKLKIHVKMTEFRSVLLQTLLDKYVFFLENVRGLEDTTNEDFVEIVDLVTEAETEEDLEPCPVKKMRLSSGSSSDGSGGSGGGVATGGRRRNDTYNSLTEEDQIAVEEMNEEEADYVEGLIRKSGMRSSERSSPNSISSASEQSDEGGEVVAAVEPLTLQEFEAVRESVQAAEQNGMIGDWQVQKCDADLVRVVVNPGYGASKKMSFIHPDVSAILSYTFMVRPAFPPQLFINDLPVSASLLRGILDKSMSKGLLNLLYNLLTLRPCFGSFNPELVETVEKGLVNAELQDLWKSLYVDNTFIGSSQNGRNYAGTVRAKACKVLAQSRVGDTCSECSVLKNVVINRSVLTSQDQVSQEPDQTKKPTNTADSAKAKSANPALQKSVWKVADSSEAGCTFVCPQLQSFNTSLPTRFSGHLQATSIMEHKVYISHDLKASIYLNGKPINRTFREFEQSKQVGPLLDWVASLRLCIGYPDQDLVEQAAYIAEKKSVLQPEIRKFFNHVLVDAEFKGKMMSGSEFVGTVRTPTCRFVAGDHADICDQCRLLQEPIEFLGL